MKVSFEQIESWSQAGDFAAVNAEIAPLDEVVKSAALDHWNHVDPEFLTFEFITENREQLARALATQRHALGW